MHGGWRWLYYVNPMAGLIDALRWSVLDGPWPGLPILVSVVVIVVLLVGRAPVLPGAERRFADVI